MRPSSTAAGRSPATAGPLGHAVKASLLARSRRRASRRSSQASLAGDHPSAAARTTRSSRPNRCRGSNFAELEGTASDDLTRAGCDRVFWRRDRHGCVDRWYASASSVRTLEAPQRAVSRSDPRAELTGMYSLRARQRRAATFGRCVRIALSFPTTAAQSCALTAPPHASPADRAHRCRPMRRCPRTRDSRHTRPATHASARTRAPPGAPPPSSLPHGNS